MEIIVASNNKGKIKEIKEILNPLNIEVYSLSDIGLNIDVVEDRDTFVGNALKKAEEIMAIVKKPVLADDSGLCVDALGGKPGVFSHRYAGDDSHLGNLKLLKEMEGISTEKRKAHFNCVMVLALPNEDPIIVEGKVHGLIATEEAGTNGFGFDPVFYLPEYNKTIAEVSDEIKNSISHRGRALQQLKDKIITVKDLFDCDIKKGNTVEVVDMEDIDKESTTIQIGEKAEVLHVRKSKGGDVVVRVKFDRNIANNKSQYEFSDYDFYPKELKKIKD